MSSEASEVSFLKAHRAENFSFSIKIKVIAENTHKNISSGSLFVSS